MIEAAMALLGAPRSTESGDEERAACGQEGSHRHLIRDRDRVYGERFSSQARILDIREAVISPRSPWQNAYAERVIGSIRRECLDHVVVIGGERHLRGILSKYVDYYNAARTHLSRARVALCAAAEPGQGGGDATRRWPPSRTCGGRRKPIDE
jgi:transposase InsO family protein